VKDLRRPTQKPADLGSTLMRAVGLSIALVSSGGLFAIVLLIGEEIRRPDTRLDVVLLSVVALSITVLASSWVSRRVVRRVTQPLSQLQSTVDALRAGSTSARVVPAGPSEIALLGTAVNALADEVDRRTGAFVRTVSHELRTPLTSIVGYLELLDDSSGDDELSVGQRGMIDAVERNSRRLLELVNDLLFVAQLDETGLLLEPGVVDLRQLVVQAVNRCPDPGDRTVEMDIGERPLLVLAEVLLLQRVVDQLFTNALLYTPADGRISLRLHATADGATLHVTDTGIGIPVQEQERVFERFYRGENTEPQALPGSGLGLAIVRGVVRQHGGTVALTSTPGIGTTVSVTLPLVAGASPSSVPHPKGAAA
jgi:signal transduction histidine kinase